MTPTQLDLVDAVNLDQIDHGKAVLEFIANHQHGLGYAPTYTEIADACHLRTHGHAAFVCSQLRLHGFLEWRHGKSRTFTLTEKGLAHAA